MHQSVYNIKYCLFLTLFIFSATVTNAQENKFSSIDSICIKKANSMIKQLKSQSKEPKYFMDNNFLVALIADSTEAESRIRILNIGEDKNLSIIITEVKLIATDNSNTKSSMLINTPIPLLNNQQMERCNSASMNIAKVKVPIAGNPSRLEYIKLKFQFANKETEILLGKIDQ